MHCGASRQLLAAIADLSTPYLPAHPPGCLPASLAAPAPGAAPPKLEEIAGGEEEEVVVCADNRGLVRAFGQLQQMYIDMGQPNTKASWQHGGGLLVGLSWSAEALPGRRWGWGAVCALLIKAEAGRVSSAQTPSPDLPCPASLIICSPACLLCLQVSRIDNVRRILVSAPEAPWHCPLAVACLLPWCS
jgi:hypothetical protein